MLTGDSLFVGDIARPDLAVEKEEGARGIFASLRALLELGDDVEVWPGPPRRVAVRRAGDGPQGQHHDRLRAPPQRAAAASATRREFVARATAGLRPQPPNFKSIVAINRGPLRAPSGRRRAAHAAPGRAAATRPVIDIRTALQFDEAHIPGAISNTMLQSGFGTRLAWIAGPDTPVVLVGRDDDDALRAAELAAAVGVGRIAGYLAGGMTSWREERLPTAVDRAA